MNIILEDSIWIQAENLRGLARFRDWTRSPSYPSRGDYSFLGTEVWIDLTREAIGHNQLRAAFSQLPLLVARVPSGRYLRRGMRLIHRKASVSTEPDGMFVSHEALRNGRVRLDRGMESLEIIGTPDVVIEIVSKTSIQKDTVALRELYATAGIAEYWLVNPIGEEVSFDILRLIARGYSAARKNDGWVKSGVFGKSFRLESTEAADGLPQYRLLVR